MSVKRPLVAGIDVGTTYCSVAYIDPGTSRPALLMVGDDYDEYVPSMIAVRDDEIIAGKVAQDLFMTGFETGVARLFKRDMGRDKQVLRFQDRSLTPQDCATELLRYLKTGAEANLPGMSLVSAVITVPANFNAARRKATLHAAEAAGLDVLRLINEPTAALIAHAEMYKDVDLKQFGRYLVFDFGGGTLDVTAAVTGQTDTEDGTPVQVINSRGRDVGGMDIDILLLKELIQAFRDKHGLDPSAGHPEVYQQLYALAVRVKEALSRADRFPVQWVWQGKALETVISRERYGELIRPVLDRAFGVVNMVLTEEKWSFDQIDRVFLIGGSCLIPLVKEHFQQQLPSERIYLRPQDCRKMVAYGAALTPQFVAMAEGHDYLPGAASAEPTLIKREPAPYSIGIVAVDEASRKLVNSQVLPRKTLVPTEGSHKKCFATTSDGQETLELVVLQGESRRPEQNLLIGRIRFDGLTPRPRGQTQVEVTIDYDLDHKVSITAQEFDNPKHRITQTVLAEGLNVDLKKILDEMRQQLTPAETKKARSKALDAAFLFDTTGSMFPNIRRVKEGLTVMLDRLGRTVPGFRLALIGYADHDQDESEPYLLKVTDFSKDTPALMREISKIEQSYGGDDPEAVEDALHAATQLGWAKGSSRAVVLVGDAPPHGVGAPDDYFAKGCPYEIDWEEQVRILLDMDVVFYTVLAYDQTPDSTARRIWQELAERSGGRYFELSDMTDIALLLEAVCAVEAGVLETWLTTLPAELRAQAAARVQ